MKLTRSDEASATIVGVEGRLDGSTSGELLTFLQGIVAEAPGQLILDFARLEYVSSAGLRVLLIIGKQVRELPTELTLCALRPNIVELFEISGLTNVFTIRASRNA